MKKQKNEKLQTIDVDDMYVNALSLLSEVELSIQGVLDKQSAFDNIETIRRYFRAYRVLFEGKILEHERENSNGQENKK